MPGLFGIPVELVASSAAHAMIGQQFDGALVGGDADVAEAPGFHQALFQRERRSRPRRWIEHIAVPDLRKIGQQAEVVGYRGSAPLISELVGGILPQAIDTLDTLLPQHQGGRVRILATSGTEREAELADVPTFREAGIDLAADGWNAFFAPAAMPQDAGLLDDRGCGIGPVMCAEGRYDGVVRGIGERIMWVTAIRTCCSTCDTKC